MKQQLGLVLIIFFLFSHSSFAQSLNTQAPVVVLVETPLEEVTESQKSNAFNLEDQGIKKSLKKSLVQWAGFKLDMDLALLHQISGGTGMKVGKHLEAFIIGGKMIQGFDYVNGAVDYDGWVMRGDINYYPFDRSTSGNWAMFYLSGKYYHLFMSDGGDLNFEEGALGLDLVRKNNSEPGYFELGLRSNPIAFTAQQLQDESQLFRSAPALTMRIGIYISNTFLSRKNRMIAP